jgi:segregation and condensation protein A
LQVKLEAFEGPLDLLLHLIDKNKVDIYNIPIVMITEQYLEYIQEIEEQDMDLMSEFLVMAATLLDIKCRMLLPPEKDEEGEEIDPRADLVRRLLEYKMYKYMSFELREREVIAGRSLFKKETLPPEVRDYQEPIDYEEALGDATLQKLYELMQMLLKRQEDKIDPLHSRFGEVEQDEIDLERKMAYVERYLEQRQRFSCRDLLEQQKGKMEIIVTFLVILELMKLGKIAAKQNARHGDIMITRTGNQRGTKKS